MTDAASITPHPQPADSGSLDATSFLIEVRGDINVSIGTRTHLLVPAPVSIGT